ncbi:DUF3392 domain-containing protein [Vibrio sp. VB16]|uniref:DUF3392 domain-containing protein n=1 Tax=Vibrio sp. VB16 TaxID=2785746 RepID=UPI0018A0DAA9|nr:DUF3392 domain-containing protein [Vibrio sp. VB16]UGA56215.1 DUF3392 domain-containing protein [Vibrio sp. VB16]
MFDIFAPVGRHIVPYIPEISIAFIACMLVILGGDINRLLRKVMVRQHFVVRTFAFVLLNAFGYGLLIVKASPYLSLWLKTLNTGLLLVSIVSCFIVIGIWAQRQRHV